MPVHWLGAPLPGKPAGKPEGTAFDLFAGGVQAGRYSTKLSGKHNLRNCLGALAACAEGYGAPLEKLRPALAEFRGVARRQQCVGSPSGIEIIDDFAHHPTAVRETLAALKSRLTSGRLLVVFEPRSATACRKLHQEAYADAFVDADLTVIAPLGRQLAPEERLDVPQLVAELRRKGQKAEAPENIESIISLLASEAKPGDHIALLSNGAFGGIHGQLLARLEAG
jgi:UDP-N-acetylmuramate: L-alanyl-gamma-D-glutamyl-meso-diaminopimelate ligase